MPRELALEQKRALAYLRLKGAEASLASLQRRIRASIDAIDRVLHEVDSKEAKVRPAAGGWSVQEVVDHLVQTHHRGVEELRCLLRGEVPPGGPIPAGLISEEPLERPWEEAVQALRTTHESFLELLAGAGDDVSQEVRAPLVMVVRVPGEDGVPRPVEWIEELDWKSYAIALRAHTLEHVAQIERILEAVRSKAG